MTPAKLNSRNQISLPREVRERLGVKAGEQVGFVATPDGIVIVRVPKREEIAGMARGANPEGFRDRNDRY